MKQIFRHTSLILLALLICSSCRSFLDTGPDAVTGATPRYQHGKTVLPPDADTYEVLGVVDGLKNYVVKYDDTLYRGGEPFVDSAAQSLKTYGIRTIISITPTDHERDFCQRNEFMLIEIPFEKTAGLTSVDLKRYLDTIRSADGPFYVHCHGGTHRGGILGVAYRVHVQRWPYGKALVEYGRLGGDLLTDYAMLESIRTSQH